MTETHSILEAINSPKDLKGLRPHELKKLATEIRKRISDVVHRNGGHLASNLGVVELTLALHYVYDFSYDRLVWDVGHQAYAHKIVTGRNRDFDTLRTAGGLSGFPNPQESPFDPFVVGHAGTAISTALGLLCARDHEIRPDKDSPKPPRVVAVVGDASIATGMSFEALNHVGCLRKRLLIVLNDNRMAIAGTVGALSRYLNRIRTASFYNEVKREVRDFLDAIPVVGHSMERMVEHVKDGVRKSLVPGWIFEELGIRYFGPTDGHDLKALIEAFHEIERLDIEGPVILHVVTEKGHGCDEAHADPRKFHGVSPASGPARPSVQCEDASVGMPVLNGKVETDVLPSTGSTYTDVFAEELVRLAESDPRIFAITAAMPDGTGLVRFAEKFPDRFFDVGICEQHALGLASGLAAGGARPVVAIYSTFVQRAYDQLFQEISLQNVPVVLALDRAGLVGSDGPTHHGAFDVAFLRALPRIVLMASAGAEELRMMLRFALTLPGPAAVRYPRTGADGPALLPPQPIVEGKGQLLCEGTDAALIAYGSMVLPAWSAAAILAREGLNVAVVNARFARPLDETLIRDVVASVPVALTVEEGSVQGGFGEGVLKLCSDAGLAHKLSVRGLPDRFITHGSREALLAEVGLDDRGIAESVRRLLK